MHSPFFIQTLVGCHATKAAAFLGSIQTEIDPHEWPCWNCSRSVNGYWFTPHKWKN